MVTLCQPHEEGGEPFWPTEENTKTKYGQVFVTLQSSTSFDYFTQRKFLIHDQKVSDEV